MIRVIFLLSFIAPALGQQTVKSVIDAINEAVWRGGEQAFAKLFTADGDLWIGNRQAAFGEYFDHGIWTETTAPMLVFRRARMLTPEIALVDAMRKQYGAMVMSSVPVLLVMRRTDGAWRVVTMHVLEDRGPIIRPAALIIQPVASGTPLHARFPPGYAATAA